MKLGKRGQSVLHYHFIVFIFGFTSILGALISIEALPLVWYRMLIASIVLGFFLLFNKKKTFLIAARHWWSLFLAGFLIALHWGAFFQAIKMVGISPTLAMLSSGALMTAVLEPLFYQRKFLLYELVFGLMALGGMLIIFNASPNDWIGMFVALAATFLGVLFTLVNGKLIENNSSTAITFYEMTIGFFIISIYFLLSETMYKDFFVISSSDGLWLFLLGTVCTAYAITGAIAVMRELNPFTIMLIINMEPLYGILLALMIFGESELMSTGFYLGLIIILLAIISNSIIKFRDRFAQKKQMGQQSATGK